MLCGLSFLKGLSWRTSRNGSSDAAVDISHNAVRAHHHSARPPPVEDEDDQADSFACLSEVVCLPPVDNSEDIHLYTGIFSRTGIVRKQYFKATLRGFIFSSYFFFTLQPGNSYGSLILYVYDGTMTQSTLMVSDHKVS